MAPTPVLPEAIPVGPLSARLRRPRMRSATTASRRLATFDRSRRTSAIRPALRSLYRLALAWYQGKARVVAMKRCAAHAIVGFNGLDVRAQIISGCLASVSVSRMRASGVVTSETTLVDIVFGEGKDGLRREVKVIHRRFPNGGEWSFFLCPVCSRTARVLRLHDKPMCRRCCLRQGIGYRVSSGSPVERDVARVARLQKLRELLDGGPVRLRPRAGRRLRGATQPGFTQRASRTPPRLIESRA